MSLLWRKQFAVGNDLIDGDHQYLVEIINRAEVCLKAGNSVSLGAVLDELDHYAKSHFEREELVAKAVGYPGAGQLHGAHSALMEQLKMFRTGLGLTWTHTDVGTFVNFLRDWLIQHVLKEDMLMKPFLSKYSPRFDPRK